MLIFFNHFFLPETYKLDALQDIVEVTEEHNRDRRDLEETQEQLLKELKLKVLIIENFIPPNERKKLLGRAVYDQVVLLTSNEQQRTVHC